MQASSLPDSPCTPLVSTLTRSVVPVNRSRTKTSVCAFVSPATKFVASLSKATYRPSVESDGKKLAPSPSMFPELTLTRSVVPVTRSRTKTSKVPFVSFATRFEASLSKAMNRPSREITGRKLLPFACAPSELTLTRVVVCANAKGGVSAARTIDARKRLAAVVRRRIRTSRADAGTSHLSG
jgi:hypothetical protein